MVDSVDCVVVGNKTIGKHALLSRFVDAEKMGDVVSVSMQVEGRTVEFVVKIADESVESKARRLMYLKADVIILGYSSVDVPSHTELRKTWVREVQSQVPTVPVILMGTKFDRVPPHLKDRVKAKGEATSSEFGALGFQAVSANPKFEGNLHVVLFERAVRAGLSRKLLRMEMQDKRKNRGLFGCLPKRQQTNQELLKEHASELEVDLSPTARSRGFYWRGELLCCLVEEFLDGRHVEYGVDDSSRDMLAPFELDDVAMPIFDVLSKLLMFYHFVPIATRCLELHNLEFWVEVEGFKHNPELLLKKKKGLKREAQHIYRNFINPQAKRDVHVDEDERNNITAALKSVPNPSVFDHAQLRLLTDLTLIFRDRVVRTVVSKKILGLLREYSELLPAAKNVEGEEFPKCAGEGLNRMLKQVVHIMTFMEYLQTPSAADKRPAHPELLKVEDSAKVVRNAAQSLVLFTALKVHIDKERSMENPMFWLDAEDYRTFDFGAPHSDESSDAYERRVLRMQASRAEYIVNRYINDDSEWLINLPATMTKSIKAQLKELQTAVASEKHGSDLIKSSRVMFDPAQREILLLIRRDSWTRFHSSSSAQDAKSFVQRLFSPEEFADPEEQRQESKFQSRFDLHPEEHLARTFYCALERKMVLHGELSLSKRYLCFFSSVFGFKTKLRYALGDIVSVTDENVESVGKRGKGSSDRAVVITTNDSQRHVFRNVLPNTKQLVYTIKKARQRLETEKQPDDQAARPPEANANADDDDDDIIKGMSEKDWELFKEGAEVVEYQEGELVFAEGTPAGNVYQIARGSCRIEKTLANGEKASLRTCEEGEIIGEISFIEGGTTSASVVANENMVVYVMSRDFIEDALVNNPGLPGRFYKFIATLLADRVKTKKVIETPQQARDAKLDKAESDALFRTKFNLSNKEDTVMHEWGASMRENNMTLFGTLYLSRGALCFYSKVLASVKREIIPLHDISQVETYQKSLVVSRKDQDKRIEFFHLADIQDTKIKLQEGVALAREEGVPMARQHTGAQEDLDWSMFLGGAELRRYKKAQFILKQGDTTQFVYQIGQGSAVAQKDTEGGMQVYGDMGPGELFGEILFLQGGVATSGVVANEDETYVYCIEKQFVDSLLELNAELPGRFYKFLAASLAARLRN